MIGRTIDEITLGEEAEITHIVTPETIHAFVDASGDDNPIHSDPAFAGGTRFGQIIAPGMLTGSFISGVIGTRLPGPGAVYLSQTLRFRRPVFVGDRVTARVEVVERLTERNRIRLVTTCRNQDDDLLLEGEAWVLPSKTRVTYETRTHPPAAADSPREFVRMPGPPSAALASRLAWAPAALPLQIASWWTEGALAFASQAARLWLAAPGSAPVRTTAAGPADPLRP